MSAFANVMGAITVLAVVAYLLGRVALLAVAGTEAASAVAETPSDDPRDK